MYLYASLLVNFLCIHLSLVVYIVWNQKQLCVKIVSKTLLFVHR